MKKRLLALFLVLCLALCLSACVAPGTRNSDTETSETAMLAPEEAAQKAMDETKDSSSISDLIRVPFGYLLDWLYEFSRNYGVALLLFSLIVKIVLLPMSIKSKKSMLKMSRLAPLAKALEAKYGDDKQKYQQELMALYKEEGVSTTGGCLWSLLPLLILLPLYYVIREPLTYMLHNARSMSAAVVAFVEATGINFSGNSFYRQLAVAGKLTPELIEQIKSCAVTAAANLKAMNFTFCGIDLSSVPSFRIWQIQNPSWNEIGLFAIPILSAGFQMLSMLVNQKMNNKVATNADGEKDEAAAKQQAQTGITMMLMMPLMSLWIGYSMPAAISIYWIAQAVFGTIQDYFLTVHYRKVYDAEDELRREKAALKRAEEAEKERQRALRREQNPDGIMDNVSKKKLKQQEKEAAEKASREYEARKRGDAPTDDQPLSGDPERPFSRGRAYSPNRYKRSGADTNEEE